MNHVPPGSTGSPLVPPFPLIRDGLRQGRVIPFLGSGASMGPKSKELAEHLANRTLFPRDDEPLNLPKVAQYYNVVAGRTILHQELHSIFDQDFPFTSLHSFLAEVPAPLLIVTTNYDDLIERAFTHHGRAYDVVIHTTDLNLGDRLLWWPYGSTEPKESLPKSLDIDLKSVTVIYKMHGAVDRRKPERDQYVITEDDYIDFLARMIKKTAIPAIFAEPFQTRHFLFLGYSLRDWNLRIVWNRMGKTLRRHKEIASWAIQDAPSPVEKRFWLDRGVDVYDMKIEDFVEKLKQV